MAEESTVDTSVDTTVELPQDAQDLSAAAQTIFPDNTFELRTGRKVVIYPAKLKQLPLVIRFFQLVMASLDEEMLGALVELISDRQLANKAAGKNPNAIDFKALSGQELVHKAFGNVNLVSTIFVAVSEQLPTLGAAFSDLTKDEFADLEVDEAILATAAIFTLNYRFFSQSLPQILRVFGPLLRGKQKPTIGVKNPVAKGVPAKVALKRRR